MTRNEIIKTFYVDFFPELRIPIYKETKAILTSHETCSSSYQHLQFPTISSVTKQSLKQPDWNCRRSVLH